MQNIWIWSSDSESKIRRWGEFSRFLKPSHKNWGKKIIFRIIIIISISRIISLNLYWKLFFICVYLARLRDWCFFFSLFTVFCCCSERNMLPLSYDFILFPFIYFFFSLRPFVIHCCVTYRPDRYCTPLLGFFLNYFCVKN